MACSTGWNSRPLAATEEKYLQNFQILAVTITIRFLQGLIWADPQEHQNTPSHNGT